MEASPLARRAPLGTLKPGRVSPMRAVPEHIERPEYMFHDLSLIHISEPTRH